MDDALCQLCPRKCGVDRKRGIGFCGVGEKAVVAKVMLHRWEEPCICFGAGSGAVFFSGCQLQCVFCQNHEISCKIKGEAMERDSLSSLFLELEKAGACNLNLVSPTPHFRVIIPALRKAKEKGLSLPVVLNSGGYEKKETLELLSGLVDIYLPDYKFFSPSLAKCYAGAEDYPAVCQSAIAEMHRQVGSPVWEGERLKKGVIVRHLILPGASKDSIAILKNLRDSFGKEGVVLSLLRQFTPLHRAMDFPSLSRRITSLEYQRVEQCARQLGFRWIYTQGKSSASEDFVPDFSSFSHLSR